MPDLQLVAPPQTDVQGTAAQVVQSLRAYFQSDATRSLAWRLSQLDALEHLADLDPLLVLAPRHPEWQEQEPFASLLKGDMEKTLAGGEHAILEIVLATHAGMTTEQFATLQHDPDRPLETLAEYCLGCYTNLNLPSRVDMLARYVEDYGADGFLINSVKSCNSFSAGQLMILREVENRTGRPGGFIESDLVDPRYFSAANIKNRLESYFQMLSQRRAAQEVAS